MTQDQNEELQRQLATAVDRLIRDDPTLPLELATVVVRALIQSGAIDPSGKTPKELHSEAVTILRETGADFEFIADHTEDLLRIARSYTRSGENHLACLLFATWLEHKLNLFCALAGAGKLTDRETQSMIRETSHRAKATWLLRAFGYRQISEPHRSRISKIMERRNAFVHYKWRDHNLAVSRELEILLRDIEGTIRYLQRYERESMKHIPKRRIARLMRKPSSST